MVIWFIFLNGHKCSPPRLLLVKLILVARFYKKPSPIWKLRGSVYKRGHLMFHYYRNLAIMGCLSQCNGNDLIKFQAGRANPFKHDRFQSQICPDHHQSNTINKVTNNLSFFSILSLLQAIPCQVPGKRKQKDVSCNFSRMRLVGIDHRTRWPDPQHSC